MNKNKDMDLLNNYKSALASFVMKLENDGYIIKDIDDVINIVNNYEDYKSEFEAFLLCGLDDMIANSVRYGKEHSINVVLEYNKMIKELNVDLDDVHKKEKDFERLYDSEENKEQKQQLLDIINAAYMNINSKYNIN